MYFPCMYLISSPVSQSRAQICSDIILDVLYKHIQQMALTLMPKPQQPQPLPSTNYLPCLTTQCGPTQTWSQSQTLQPWTDQSRAEPGHARPTKKDVPHHQIYHQDFPITPTVFRSGHRCSSHQFPPSTQLSLVYLSFSLHPGHSVVCCNV